MSKSKRCNDIGELGTVEFLRMLNETDNLGILEWGCSVLLDQYTSDSFLAYILDDRISDRLGHVLEKTNAWIDDQFSNGVILDHGEFINQLIIERGLNGNVTVTNMDLMHSELTIEFKGRRKLVSLWNDNEIPEALIDNWLDVSKNNLIAEILSTVDSRIIRKLILKIRKLKKEGVII